MPSDPPSSCGVSTRPFDLVLLPGQRVYYRVMVLYTVPRRTVLGLGDQGRLGRVDQARARHGASSSGPLGLILEPAIPTPAGGRTSLLDRNRRFGHGPT